MIQNILCLRKNPLELNFFLNLSFNIPIFNIHTYLMSINYLSMSIIDLSKSIYVEGRENYSHSKEFKTFYNFSLR